MFDLGEFTLRRPERADAQSIFVQYAQDPEVTRYLIWRPHQNLAESQAWIDRCIAEFDEQANLKLVIVPNDTNEAIGMIDAVVDGHQVVVGYVLAKKYWGMGIMTSSLREVCRYFLVRPNIYRVFATHDLDNPASGRVMEKAGMRFEGILRRASMLPNLSSEPRDAKLWAAVKG